MIEEFEKKDSPAYVETVQRGYALGLGHKHLPEMQRHAGLAHPPLFTPSVARFYRGMLVEMPLQLWALPGTPAPRDIHAVLANAYRGRPLVEVASLDEAAGMKSLDAEILASRCGWWRRWTIWARALAARRCKISTSCWACRKPPACELC